ncbi:hypothetical protein EYW49_21950 [Siculibacillus lacustris]|uniref:Uncharacterized protein n=1 Tax=Siculibacillus lacustris TaxID=1549641 RepID=A0A4Q9VF10_9HYPH|nr:hypothetical protein [Siculibacillus lacustris]TBW32604.1 hypothetical protein EYW49_21950 [Siculibacillus lacustris]
MIDIETDPIHADIEAWDLAAAVRDRASAMGRDPVVLLAAALLLMDRDGMLAWMRAQKSTRTSGAG